MTSALKTGESILLYLGILLVSLVVLYGLSGLVIKYAPSPVNGWFGSLVGRSTPAGWGITSSSISSM